jgi:hypothetical protein
MLKKFFEVMLKSFFELASKDIVDYDMETKKKINSNIGLVYARILEADNKFDEVVKVCESLLKLPLNLHTKKFVMALKARRSGKG